MLQHASRLGVFRLQGTETTNPEPTFRVLAETCSEAESGQTDQARLETMTPEQALRNALDDPDSQPLPPELRAKLRRVPNSQAIRAGMGLTQEAFARRFQIALGTPRDWEQGGPHAG